MAQVPCELHHVRFRGPARYYYPTMVHGQSQIRQRLRLCGECAADVRGFCEEALEPVQPELVSQEEDRLCAYCRTADPRHYPWAVFVTAYWAADARSDYYGRVHDLCAEPMAASLSLPWLELGAR